MTRPADAVRWVCLDDPSRMNRKGFNLYLPESCASMNEIRKRPLKSIGYDFVPAEYLPAGKNEYYLRNLQNRSGISYRNLSAYEIEVLVRNNNSSDDWTKIF